MTALDLWNVALVGFSMGIGEVTRYMESRDHFLDEIGDLPMETQIALLRALQERQIERVVQLPPFLRTSGRDHPLPLQPERSHL